jgi:gliding motility-associated-like protein
VHGGEDDSVNWMPICGYFKASGGEQYMTIGNFYDIDETPLLTLYPHPGIVVLKAYYLVDDISAELVPNLYGWTKDRTVCSADSISKYSLHCSSTTTLQINVLDVRRVFLPNVFSPNGDGENDQFVIDNLINYPVNKLQIFDRQGRVVYTQSNYLNNWDGQYNGNFLPQDTYYYLIIFDNGAGKKTGFISLIK